MSGNLTDRVALVTGGANGIGKRISEVLGEAGCRVAFCDIDEIALERFSTELKDREIPGLAIKADISQSADVDRVLKEVAETWEAPDILVNNAGITRDTLLIRMAEKDWDAVIAVNLKAAFLLTKAALRPMMKKRGGRIINIASVVGVMGNAGQANYAASKAGLIALTKSTAREVAARNITVNAIAPGFIETAMTAKLPTEVIDQYKQTIPLTRLGQPEDIARAVEFLASDAASYITGQVLRVDGGLIMA